MYLRWSTVMALVMMIAGLKVYNSTENQNLYSSMNIIVKEALIIDNVRILFFANYKKSSKEQRFYFDDFLNTLASDIKNFTFKILVQHQKTLMFKIPHTEVLLLHDIDSLNYFYEHMYKTGNFNLSHTLMYIASITTLDTAALTLVFKQLFHMSVLNIALIVRLSQDNIVMVTYFPFTPDACYSVEPVVFNRYNAAQHKWIHSDYFPPKLDNFYGCPVTCATWEDMPYMALKFNTTNQEIISYEGFEGKLLEFVASRLNFSIKLYFLSHEEIDETYNETGLIFQKLFSNSVDFALGAFYFKPNVNNDFPYSQTAYYYLSHTYMVTNVFNVYSTYEKMAYPFQAKLWYLIGCVLAVSSVLIYACECSRRFRVQRNFIIGAANRTPHYYLYTLAVGATMTSAHVPRYNFARFLFTCWMLATLVLRSAYQSGMYQMLRDNKHRNPPQTIADVLRQNYVILLKGVHRRLYDILPEMKNVRDFNETMLATFPEMEKAKERTAVLTHYEYFGYLGKINSTTWRRLHVVNERIYTQQMAMNVRLHSYLVNELNDQILNAQYFGFVTRWAREYFGNPSDRNSVAHDAESVQTNTLSMHELGAVFMILFWLHLLAVPVFIIELMWHKYGATVFRIIRKH